MAPNWFQKKVSPKTGLRRKTYKRHTGAKRRGFGAYVLKSFETVMINLATTAIRSKVAREKREEARAEPFELLIDDNED